MPPRRLIFTDSGAVWRINPFVVIMGLISTMGGLVVVFYKSQCDGVLHILRDSIILRRMVLGALMLIGASFSLLGKPVVYLSCWLGVIGLGHILHLLSGPFIGSAVFMSGILGMASSLLYLYYLDNRELYKTIASKVLEKKYSILIGPSLEVLSVIVGIGAFGIHSALPIMLAVLGYRHWRIEMRLFSIGLAVIMAITGSHVIYDDVIQSSSVFLSHFELKWEVCGEIVAFDSRIISSLLSLAIGVAIWIIVGISTFLVGELSDRNSGSMSTRTKMKLSKSKWESKSSEDVHVRDRRKSNPVPKSPGTGIGGGGGAGFSPTYRLGRASITSIGRRISTTDMLELNDEDGQRGHGHHGLSKARTSMVDLSMRHGHVPDIYAESPGRTQRTISATSRSKSSDEKEREREEESQSIPEDNQSDTVVSPAGTTTPPPADSHFAFARHITTPTIDDMPGRASSLSMPSREHRSSSIVTRPRRPSVTVAALEDFQSQNQGTPHGHRSSRSSIFSRETGSDSPNANLSRRSSSRQSAEIGSERVFRMDMSPVGESNEGEREDESGEGEGGEEMEIEEESAVSSEAPAEKLEKEKEKEKVVGRGGRKWARRAMPKMSPGGLSLSVARSLATNRAKSDLGAALLSRVKKRTGSDMSASSAASASAVGSTPPLEGRGSGSSASGPGANMPHSQSLFRQAHPLPKEARSSTGLLRALRSMERKNSADRDRDRDRDRDGKDRERDSDITPRRFRFRSSTSVQSTGSDSKIVAQSQLLADRRELLSPNVNAGVGMNAESVYDDARSQSQTPGNQSQVHALLEPRMLPRDDSFQASETVDTVTGSEYSDYDYDSFDQLKVIIVNFDQFHDNVQQTNSEFEYMTSDLQEIVLGSDHLCTIASSCTDAVVKFSEAEDEMIDLVIIAGAEGDVLDAISTIRSYEQSIAVEGFEEAALIVIANNGDSESRRGSGTTGSEQSESGIDSEDGDGDGVGKPDTTSQVLDAGANDYIMLDDLVNILPRVLQQLSTMKAFREFNRESEEMRIEAEARADLLQAVLERFLPPYFHELVDPGGLSLEELRLGAAMEKVATVMFSDIRKFTTLTEKLSSTDAMQFLNTYFAFAFPSIMDQGGFVEKTIGDSIMAIFLGENQAMNAITAAIACQKSLDFMNETGFKTGIIETGIGISLGRMMMGIVGTESRMELTVIGDRVNLGARVEALCKVYGSRILVAGHVYDALGGHTGEFKIRKVDNLTVRGRVKPTIVYEVYDADKPQRIIAKDSILLDYNRGVDLFEKGDFTAALSCFKICKSKFSKVVSDGEDIPTSHFIARCRQLIAHPPKEWNGVCHFEDKTTLVYEGMGPKGKEEAEADVPMRIQAKDIPIVRLESVPASADKGKRSKSMKKRPQRASMGVGVGVRRSGSSPWAEKDVREFPPTSPLVTPKGGRGGSVQASRRDSDLF